MPSKTASKPCVIIVEPDKRLGALLKAQMSQRKLTAVVVPSVTRLMSTLEKKEPVALAIDMSVGAIEVIKTLRKKSRYKKIPMLVMAIYATREDVVHAKGAGATDFIITSQSTPREVVTHITHHIT